MWRWERGVYDHRMRCCNLMAVLPMWQPLRCRRPTDLHLRHARPSCCSTLRRTLLGVYNDTLLQPLPRSAVTLSRSVAETGMSSA